MISKELQNQVLKLPLQERWQLVQKILISIQSETGFPKSEAPKDSNFPHIYCRAGSSGDISPTIKGTRIRVQTIVISAQQWKWQPEKIATEYGLSEAQVLAALSFYELNKDDIDSAIASEGAFAAAHGQA